MVMMQHFLGFFSILHLILLSFTLWHWISVIMQFIVELHYKIATAVHHRHKCHRLAGVEVLINVLGHRAAVSSASK